MACVAWFLLAAAAKRAARRPATVSPFYPRAIRTPARARIPATRPVAARRARDNLALWMKSALPLIVRMVCAAIARVAVAARPAMSPRVRASATWYRVVPRMARVPALGCAAQAVMARRLRAASPPRARTAARPAATPGSALPPATGTGTAAAPPPSPARGTCAVLEAPLASRDAANLPSASRGSSATITLASKSKRTAWTP